MGEVKQKWTPRAEAQGACVYRFKVEIPEDVEFDLSTAFERWVRKEAEVWIQEHPGQSPTLPLESSND